MGICCSYRKNTAATAKLILEDGRLKEFSHPIRVSQILQGNPTSFICNSDDLSFDDQVSAIGDEVNLELGEIYFELPISWLDSPIKAEDMAALAVKASLAMKIGNRRVWYCRWFRLRSSNLVELNEKKAFDTELLVTIGGSDSGGFGRGAAARRSKGSKERKSSSDLSIILEEEMIN
ncbi:hypothetical protein JCGZ_10044 [Jatropha curcas]|uniref:Uncharacterized protein n=1 Tax=Jatropha curcas TaxID=180498 RepID=A0A067LP27_JATCU|nr:uncharacterized protein LOC105634361 [Jatropha curcas]KDP46204.1 hypothetical protein JCGZ_10044 [Jatropha curcas]